MQRRPVILFLVQMVTTPSLVLSRQLVAVAAHLVMVVLLVRLVDPAVAAVEAAVAGRLPVLALVVKEVMVASVLIRAVVPLVAVAVVLADLAEMRQPLRVALVVMEALGYKAPFLGQVSGTRWVLLVGERVHLGRRARVQPAVAPVVQQLQRTLVEVAQAAAEVRSLPHKQEPMVLSLLRIQQEH